jgi:putative addiction module component (TIGR02574 family)
MSSIVEELEAAALSLPHSERARLARRLLASLEDETDVGEAWRDEVRRRLEAYREGKVESTSAADVLGEARDRLSG